MENKKIVFLHVGGHYVHRAFANSVTEKFVDINNEPIPRNYDVYLLEASYHKAILMRMFGQINKKSKIINIFADPRLYLMKSGRYLDTKSNKIKRYPWLKRKISKFLVKRVDGGICVSKFEQSLLNEFSPHIPTKVVYPFIRDERMKILSKISPKLEGEKILFVGNNDYYYKGLDIMIKSFSLLKKKRPNAKLYVLGNIPVREEWKIKDVFFEGRVEIAPYLKKCSLCVHPSRGEAFGVSVVESLLAGVPVIVSKQTGSGEILKKIDNGLLFNLNPQEISNKIEDYFDSPQSYKRKISQQGRKEAKKFTRKKQVAQFKRSFFELLKRA